MVNSVLTVVNIYLPNLGQVECGLGILQELASFADGSKIILGVNLNLTIDPTIVFATG